MSDTEILWFVGLDWGSETHRVSLFDRTGALVGRRDVAHSGPAYGALCEWLLRTTQAAPGQIGVAIETSHGPVVDALLERGFQLYAINPKQLDKFRDRYSMAGAKDDTRDADTLGRCLRTDRDAFRPLSLTHPLLVQLRGATRLAEELTRTHGRLASQLREQLWRYYPQILALADDVADAWLLDLWRLAPTQAKGAKLHKETIARLLKPHRIRRLDADQVRQVLREPALPVAPGVTEAATRHIRSLLPRLRLVSQSVGSTSPRCSPRPTSPCNDETTTPCAPCVAPPPSPAAAARAASCCDDWPATSGWPMRSIIGPASPRSAILSVRADITRCASADSLMGGPCAPSAIGCWHSPAPCSNARSGSIPTTADRSLWRRGPRDPVTRHASRFGQSAASPSQPDTATAPRAGGVKEGRRPPRSRGAQRPCPRRARRDASGKARR